jgi:hypothetical protein
MVRRCGTSPGYPAPADIYPPDAWAGPKAGTSAGMANLLRRAGFEGWHLQSLSLGSIALCIGLWIRAKTVDQDERGNAERRALFVGLWPPMFWLIGDSVERSRSSGPRRRRLRVTSLR